ncbi:hypothetical protein BDR07DRAFT_1496442 [Suillus spraguei]|nr:hypothetical protein BDR07DRAFT_1496442 [Suillus spraguei]
MPAVKSEDAMEDTNVAVAADKDIDMSHEADTEQHTPIAVVAPSEPEVQQPAAIASADDFPPKHWQEDTDDTTIPPPTPVARSTTLPVPSSSVKLSIHECVVILAAQVADMQMADHNALARDHSILNPPFPPPMMSQAHGSSATTMGMRYFNGVFGPLVALTPHLVGIGQPSVSTPFGCPDLQGSTFTSGQASSALVHAGPSSTPASASHFSATSPPSATHSLP